MQMAQQINDPSDKLAPQLQNHVHLLSNHRYPTIAHVSVEQASHYLIQAPTVVKQVAPMSWTYLQAPQDGTVVLEWLSGKHQDQQQYSSDGYVWGDPESSFQQEYAGYVVEMRVHTAGYRPGIDQTTSHARTRYRLIQKHPSVNAPPPDPCLWIVHYHQADPNRMMPANQMPVTTQTRQTMNERRFLESQGVLERKEFMLHDREHWPTIQMPTGNRMPQPGAYGANAMAGLQLPQHRQAQSQSYYPQQQSGGQPPAKRQRQAAPSNAARGSESLPDTTIEDEENTALGDYFDHLTPRDISVARYSQHHRWMEEVFSSPYASGQIVPADLGLGLMGELKGLTEGILEPPSDELVQGQKEKTGKPKEAPPFTNLKQEQLEEFNKRVDKHLADGQAEIQRMKEEHAAKMQEWKKTKTLSQAEKRLRLATWEGQDNNAQTLRLEAPNGHAEGGAQETIEDVIRDVEASLGVRIVSRKDVSLVEKGGLEREEERPQDARRGSGMDLSKDIPSLQQPSVTDTGNSSSIDFKESPAPPTLGEQLDDKIPPEVPQPTFSPAPPQQQPSPVGQQQQHYQQPQQPTQQDTPGDGMSQAGDPLDNANIDDDNNQDTSFMDDINMDLDNTDFQLDTPSNDQPAQPQSDPQPQAQPEQQPQAPETQQQQQSTLQTEAQLPANTTTAPGDAAEKAMETPTAAPSTTANTAAAESAEPGPTDPGHINSANIPPSTITSAEANTATPAAPTDDGPALFQDDVAMDNTFNDLADFGDEHGDAAGLIDFEGGGGLELGGSGMGGDGQGQG